MDSHHDKAGIGTWRAIIGEKMFTAHWLIHNIASKASTCFSLGLQTEFWISLQWFSNYLIFVVKIWIGKLWHDIVQNTNIHQVYPVQENFSCCARIAVWISKLHLIWTFLNLLDNYFWKSWFVFKPPPTDHPKEKNSFVFKTRETFTTRQVGFTHRSLLLLCTLLSCCLVDGPNQSSMLVLETEE